jgi:hypothetical protein
MGPGRGLAADVLNARRLDDLPDMTFLSIPGAVGPYAFSDRDQWAQGIALRVGDTDALDELGHRKKPRRAGAD